MKTFFVLFMLVMASQAGAADGNKVLAGFDPRTDFIAENYDAGQFLIYDCVEGHWTCVTEPFYRDCESNRAFDLEQKKKDLRCAPLGSFPTKKSCFQRQLFMTSNNHGYKFCVSAEWKQREIIFDQN